MTHEQGHNRRRARRVPVRLRILFTRAGTSVAIEAHTDDISLDGVFVRTERRPPDVGTKLGLLLEFEPAPELMLSGVVARVREADDADPEASSPGMGIRFVDMDGGKREALMRALEGTGAFETVRDTVDDG